MNKEIKGGLAWAGAFLVIAIGATMARKLGYIDSDMVTKVTIAPMGLMIAWYGNRLPKTFVSSARARKVNRVSGWSMALSGLVYAALFAFAPGDLAVIGGCAAILAGILVTFGYCLTLRGKTSPA